MVMIMNILLRIIKGKKGGRTIMKEYSVGIMGTGGMAHKMARTLAVMDGVKCGAAASRTLEKAQRFADEFEIEKAYGSYEELAADDSIDMIYIATPHSEHLANARICIHHHKPVLVEKAFTANVKQAEELFSYAEKENVFVTEAIWVRYMPFLNKIKEVLASGVIGTPTMLTANLGYDIDHNKRLTDPMLAGGALLDVGVYALNFACMLFGDDYERICSACTYHTTGVDEQDSMTLIYPDGKMAVLNASMLSVSDRKGIIHGDKGFMIIENINNFESISVYNKARKRIAYYEREKQITGYEYEVQSALEAIENGKFECSEMPHNETIHMMQLMDTLRKQWKIKYPFE